MNLTHDLAAELVADSALLFSPGHSLRSDAVPLPLPQIAELLAQQMAYDLRIAR